MKKESLISIMIVTWSIVLAGCNIPADNFERENINDPASSEFVGGSVTGLRVEADANGLILLQWPEADDIIDKHVIEKSLGDSSSFSTIAELEAGVLQYIDSTRDVRKETYYRLSSYIEFEGKDDVLYGRTKTKLRLGEISNEEFVFLDESNSLQLLWKVDAPLYTHFIISSENVISEQQENSVRIASGSIKNVFEDPLLDIDFETRNYTISGIIEYDGGEDIIAEKEFTFDAASFFKPKNIEINIQNEKDWEVSWEGEAFFATEIELIRETINEDHIFQLPAETSSYIDSLILDDFQDSRINQFRRYTVRFITETGESEAIETFDGIDIAQPVIAVSNVIQNDPNSLAIFGAGFGDDSGLIKEYIIEKPHEFIPERYVEIARVDGGKNFQFIDTDVNGTKNPTYRVRTVTSYPSDPVTFAYSHDYELDYAITTGMNYVTSMEISSDKKYLAAVSFRSGLNNSILITDIETRQPVSEITIPSQQISDIKISPDDSSIYFAVPTDSAIYKADFPSGENIEKIINNARVNSDNVFHLGVSSDDSFIIGTGGQGFLKRWNLPSKEVEFLIGTVSSPTFYTYKNIAISPDGSVIGGNNGGNYILDAQNGMTLEFLPWSSPNMTDAQFSSDGQYYSFVSNFESTYIYSTESWEQVQVLNSGRRADFHPDKSEMVIVARNSVYTIDLKTLKIGDVISDPYGGRPYPGFENKIVYIDDDRVGVVQGLGTIQFWKKKAMQRRWKNVY